MIQTRYASRKHTGQKSPSTHTLYSLLERTVQCTWERTLTVGIVQPEEEKAARGPNICLQISEGWVSGVWGQTLFSSAQRQDKG